MTVVLISGTGMGGIFTGLSSDTKPSSGEGFAMGALFLETDTGILWSYDGSNWCDGVMIKSFNYSLKGSLPPSTFLIGNNTEIVTGLTATDAAERMMANAHLRIVVNSLTGSGTVTITGDSVLELTGIPSVADTENLTVDATGEYQSAKKWLRITGITIPGGISAIDYDLWKLSYFDHGNQEFKVSGYRLEVFPTNAVNVDFQLEIWKVQDEGSGKMSLVEIEDITLSGTTPWIVDGFHATEASVRGDRGYDTATASPWNVGEPMSIKMGDFDTEFSADEHIFEGLTKHEGFIIRITWDNCDFMTMSFDIQHFE